MKKGPPPGFLKGCELIDLASFIASTLKSLSCLRDISLHEGYYRFQFILCVDFPFGLF